MRWRSRTRRETFENWQQNVRRVTRTSIRVYFPVLRNHTLIYNTVCSVTTFNFANKFHPLQTVRRILSFFIKPLDNKLGFFRVNVLFCRIVLIMVPVNTRFESTLFFQSENLLAFYFFILQLRAFDLISTLIYTQYEYPLRLFYFGLRTILVRSFRFHNAAVKFSAKLFLLTKIYNTVCFDSWLFCPFFNKSLTTVVLWCSVWNRAIKLNNIVIMDLIDLLELYNSVTELKL